MIRAIILAAALCLVSIGAHAQRLALHAGDVGGMQIPDYNSNSVCSPGCIGFQIDMVVPTPTPTGLGASGIIFLWGGISGIGGITTNALCAGSTCDCTAGCLAQFGLKISGFTLTGTPTYSYQPWWEVFPTIGVQNIGSSVTPGHVLRWQFQCTNNCTNAAASQSYSVTLVELNNGATVQTINMGTQFGGFSLGFNQSKAGIEEQSANMTFTTPVHWSGYQVNQSGCTTGCTTAGLALYSLSQNNITFHSQGSGSSQTYSVASGSFNSNHDFNACISVTTNGAGVACAATPMVGPGTFSENVHRLLEKNRIMEAMR